jgi:hypothetical protein
MLDVPVIGAAVLVNVDLLYIIVSSANEPARGPWSRTDALPAVLKDSMYAAVVRPRATITTGVDGERSEDMIIPVEVVGEVLR